MTVVAASGPSGEGPATSVVAVVVVAYVPVEVVEVVCAVGGTPEVGVVGAVAGYVLSSSGIAGKANCDSPRRGSIGNEARRGSIGTGTASVDA